MLNSFKWYRKLKGGDWYKHSEKYKAYPKFKNNSWNRINGCDVIKIEKWQ
jgi:hypothetical protein